MTTRKTDTTAEPQIKLPPEVCDSCLLPAHDAGIDGEEAQAFTMRSAGEVLDDHLCDAKEEPDYYPDGCGCGCYRVRIDQAD